MKSIFDSALKFIIYGNYYISFAAFVLTYVTIDLSFNLKLTVSVFNALGVFAIYNLSRAAQTSSNAVSFPGHSLRMGWIKKHQKLLFIQGIISIFLAFGCGIFIPINILLILLLGAFISILYYFPVLRIKVYPEGVKLRNINFLKLFLISLCWTLVTMADIIYLNQKPDYTEFIIRFIFIISITIPFDIRDQKIDTEIKLKTLANQLGTSKAKMLVIGLWILLISIMAITYEKEIVGFLPLFLTAFLLIIRLNDSNNDYYYAAGWDGLIYLYALGYYFAQ